MAHCKTADVNRAVAAARRVFNGGTWSQAEPEEQKEVLLKVAQLVRDHTLEIVVLESLDTGKTINDCMDEIGGEVPKFFQWYGELADKTFGKIAPTGPGAMALITKEPAGVAGAVLPWNFPLVMAAWKIAPALAVGCSAVVKPAEQTPLSTIRLAELMQEAGVPAGVINIVPMRSTEEALAVAGNTDYGLHATVFTQDIDRALHMARALPCGTVSVNAFSEGDIKTPFGGYKQSGSLVRDNGTEALEQYLQTKTIWIQTSFG